MKINSIRIENYKGWADSGEVALSPEFNVVVGPNNAGKTAFIEGFRFGANVAHPHRSLKRSEEIRPPERSRFYGEFSLAPGEFQIGASAVGDQIYLGLPAPHSESAQAIFDQLQSGFTARLSAPSGGALEALSYPPHQLFDGATAPNASAQFVRRSDGTWQLGGLQGAHNDHTHTAVHGLMSRRIYVFKAERYNVGKCPLLDTDLLQPDCQNLPAVLAKLNKNRFAFDKFNNFVSIIFPSIKSVTVSQTENQLEIFLYSVETERSDLAISLSESGTGISQVLSILYVLMTQRSSVIVIDEPNSFLHPGAAKKLTEIMRLFPQHQYVVSTHSPEVISSLSPDNILLVTSDGGESRIKSLGSSDIANLKTVLDEVGSSLADIFGLEAVIWVEGQTEAECFPAILRKIGGVSPVGVSFVPMRHTSDFEARRRDAQEAWDIYERLSTSGSLLPVAAAFSFDRETRSEREMEDMTRRSRGAAKFLPRRMYENYLLSVPAISAVIGQELGVAPEQDDVRAVLDAAILSDGSDAVDAARILKEVFYATTDNKLRYRKLQHSVMLTDWLLENDPNSISELTKFVVELVPSKFVRKIS